MPAAPPPFKVLIAGGGVAGLEGVPRYLRARITGGHGFSSEVSEEPLWTPPVKIAARYLAPYLEGLD
jgi:hypothetical protein